MQFEIDFTETFPNLARAPIVEAVIHWQARVERKLDPDDLFEELKIRLPDYPKTQPQRELAMQAQIESDGTSTQLHRSQWLGFRFESENGRYVAQFTRNGFVFSRLKPYENWDLFEEEAQRLWRIYCEMAAPTDIQRLGVRFINVIAPAFPENLDALLSEPPRIPTKLELSFLEIMYQSRYEIPGHPYRLNVIQALQPPNPDSDSFGLILDLDVGTTHPMSVDDQSLKQRLAEMHWIKNKAFFTFLTSEAIEGFKEPA